jgi:hypothetical protein
MSSAHRSFADPYGDLQRKPRENSSLAKNLLKFTTAYIVRQSNCRWHCEPIMLLNLGLNNDKCIHTLPLRPVPFHISPSLSLPLQTLRLVSLISLIAKTKRIAERSDTNCDTHTHTHRQSTLDKYMIN